MNLTVVPGFTENWFPQQSRDALTALAVSVADVPGRIVEFGSWEGLSTVVLAKAVHPRSVDAVDTWTGSPGEISEQLATKRDVYAKFRANVAHYTRGNVTAFRCGWRDYALGPTAFCFIDAEHSYQEVRDNVEAVMPWMAAGGILCGDDAHHPPIRQALDDVFGLGTLDFDATMWIRRC